MKQTRVSKDELFSSVSVPKALLTMAVPTVISQAINLIYNMVDAFFVGRTGNSYMMAATSLTLTMVMMNAAWAICSVLAAEAMWPGSWAPGDARMPGMSAH